MHRRSARVLDCVGGHGGWRFTHRAVDPLAEKDRLSLVFKNVLVANRDTDAALFAKLVVRAIAAECLVPGTREVA